MAEMDVTVRVVIRSKGERSEYSKKLTDKTLTEVSTFWAQNAEMKMKQAAAIVHLAIHNEHGDPHDAPR